MEALQAANATELKLIRVIEDAGFPTERWLHRKFAGARISGEWFYFCEDMLTIVTPDELPVVRERIVRPIWGLEPERQKQALNALDELSRIRAWLNEP